MPYLRINTSKKLNWHTIYQINEKNNSYQNISPAILESLLFLSLYIIYSNWSKNFSSYLFQCYDFDKDGKEGKQSYHVCFKWTLIFVIMHSYHKTKIGYRIYDFYLIRTSLVLRYMLLLLCRYILCLITHGISPYFSSFLLLFCACVVKNNEVSN